jgi:hypothetical protein
MASILNCGRTTLYERFKAYPELREAVDAEKKRTIGAVANRLIEDALAGNTVAQIFFLKTQAGWVENQRLEVHGSGHVRDADPKADAEYLLAVMAEMKAVQALQLTTGDEIVEGEIE